MRIMYCLPEMSHPGGIARVETLKANWLVDHGHDVYMITTDQNNLDLFYKLDDRVLFYNIDIDFTSYRNNNILSKYIIRRKKINKYEQSLKHIVNNWNPDIIVSTFNNECAFLYKWNDGSKKILEYHFCHAMNDLIIKHSNISFFNKLQLWLKKQQMEYVSTKYDAFVVLTKEDAMEWIDNKNLHVIPNILSFETKYTSSCSNKRVIAVGRLDFQKSFDRLIDIWKKVDLYCPDWHLDIFGNGPDYNILADKINNYNLNNKVTIHNPTVNIQEEYLNSSIMVMTSIYEGLPMTLLESFCSGVPCISYSYKCGPRDIISNGANGFVVNDGDESEFVDKLVYLMRNNSDRIAMGQTAKEKSKEFEIDKIMNIWLKLFFSINDD